jgi:hypothetical protein
MCTLCIASARWFRSCPGWWISPVLIRHDWKFFVDNHNFAPETKSLHYWCRALLPNWLFLLQRAGKRLQGIPDRGHQFRVLPGKRMPSAKFRWTPPFKPHGTQIAKRRTTKVGKQIEVYFRRPDLLPVFSNVSLLCFRVPRRYKPPQFCIVLVIQMSSTQFSRPVHTRSGPVQGKTFRFADGRSATAFLGIPYAGKNLFIFVLN